MRASCSRSCWRRSRSSGSAATASPTGRPSSSRARPASASRRAASRGAASSRRSQTEDNQPQDLGIPVADPNRLNNLAVLYAELAMSDPVRAARADSRGRSADEIIATPLVRGDNRIMLPLIDLTAIAETRRGAMVLASRTARALETHVREQQAANEVPPADRVVIEEVMRPKGALVYQPRSKTMPIVVFLAVMLATSGIAFLLENVRPRSRAPGRRRRPARARTPHRLDRERDRGQRAAAARPGGRSSRVPLPCSPRLLPPAGRRSRPQASSCSRRWRPWCRSCSSAGRGCSPR